MKDYRTLLADVRFWDADAERFFHENGSMILDRGIQNREEIILLCEWMEQHSITTYLEIGVWTGRLITALHEVFQFKTALACDLGIAKKFELELSLPEAVHYFEGNSRSPIFQNWLNRFDPIELAFIDAEHTHDTLEKNFELLRQRNVPHIAVHGILENPYFGGETCKFWNELEGEKTELTAPMTEVGPEAVSFGIGVWSAPQATQQPSETDEGVIDDK